MLAAVESNLVISESPLIDFVLRSYGGEKAVADEQRAQWLQWVIGALVRKRGNAVRSFVKFDSWQVLHLPLIRRAFPDVPWIFIYREPLEILASHQQQPGSQMVPGMLDSRSFGIRPEELHQMPPDEYSALVLAAILQAAIADTLAHGGVLMNYSQLPDAACSLLPRVFGVEYHSNDFELMRNAARFHSKNPALNFEPDSVQKREKAGTRLVELTDKWPRAPYERLETLRKEQLRVG